MIKGKLNSIRWALGLIVVATLLTATGIVAASASAEVTCEGCSPWWHLTAGSMPGNLPAGGEGQITAVAEDLGDAPLDGSPVTLTAKLPAGLTAQSASLGMSGLALEKFFGLVFCEIQPRAVNCTIPAELAAEFLARPYSHVEVFIDVAVAAGATSGEVDEISVSGGGAQSDSVERPLSIGNSTSFGVEQYELLAENADGSLDTQAGS
ncbi:MAG TPA: hypothetical protein VMU32_06380, partial [Solirubrobacteraceae bacterium]|nr:hypothetical protein [Solirubrobacteraceae bacterium]